MPSIDDVVQFVREQTQFAGALTPDTTLQADIGVFGDDMHDFITAYAKRFSVDVSTYLWYFHTGEEGWSIGGLFYDPPSERVQQVPITIRMLHEFTERGRWSIDYPQHELPKRRVDILINQFVTLIAFAALVAIVWHHFIR